MLLNRRHWCVNGTGLMPTNILIRIWIQIYDFLLHIHVQEVTMSGQNLHKLHMVTNSYVLEASAEIKNKVKNYLRKTLSFSTGQLPIFELENGKKRSKEREFLVYCSLLAHILPIPPQSTIYRDLIFPTEKGKRLKFLSGTFWLLTQSPFP